MATTPVFLQGKFHGQRSMAGYHPWGCQKSATTEHTSMWSIQQCHHREVAQLCPTLHDPMDCNPSGSSIYGIFQTKVLEWDAISFLWEKKKKQGGTVSCSVVSDSLWSHGQQPTRLLCPWNSRGKNTGVGCHCLLRSRFQILYIGEKQISYINGYIYIC